MYIQHRLYRACLRAGILLLPLIILASCGGTPNPVVKPTPTPTPKLSDLVLINLGIPAEALNSPVTGPLSDTKLMPVRLTFKLNEQTVNRVSGDKIQAGKTEDAKNLANQLGISDDTYQKIKAYLGVQNVQLTLSKLHTELKVEGKPSRIGPLFHTSFVNHSYQGRTFYAPSTATPAKLPWFILQQTESVAGLDTYSRPVATGHTTQATQTQRALSSNSTYKSRSQHRAAADCNTAGHGLSAPAVAHAYGYDQFLQHGWHGENMTINLVEIDTFYQSDVLNYFQCAHYRGNLQVVNVDNTPTQAGGESTLDLDMISGLAPATNIVDYQTDGGAWINIIDELQAVIDNNTNNTRSGSVVSISLGGAEKYLSADMFKAMNQRLQLLEQVEHMTVFVSTGDCAAFGDQKYGDLSVQVPSTDPYVVAVGGTQLTVDNAGNRGSEKAWSNPAADKSQCQNQWGTGGGDSIHFQRSSGQNAPGVPLRKNRMVSDVSAVADNLAVYLGGQWIPDGGTSASAPIWAAGMALTNQGLIQTKREFFYGPSVFYQVANKSGRRLHPYYDVRQGDNLKFKTGSGWDYPTGLGTPNLVDFYRVLLANA